MMKSHSKIMHFYAASTLLDHFHWVFDSLSLSLSANGALVRASLGWEAKDSEAWVTVYIPV